MNLRAVAEVIELAHEITNLQVIFHSILNKLIRAYNCNIYAIIVIVKFVEQNCLSC